MYIYKINPDPTNLSHSKIGLINSFTDPQLDCCFENSDSSYVYSVGLDKQLKVVNLEKLDYSIMGSHEDAISAVVSFKEGGCVYTSGWDECIKVWDMRSQNEVGQFDPELNVSHMVSLGDKMIMAGIDTQGNDIIKIFDLRNINEPLKFETSPLKNQTTSLCSSEFSERYIIGCLDGRICSDSLEGDSTSTKGQYLFKAHKEELEDKIIFYPVTAVVYHPKKEIYVSGGADKYLYAWDDKKRKRLFKTGKYPETISSQAINNEGTVIAIASSSLPKSPDEYKSGLESSSSHSIIIKALSI